MIDGNSLSIQFHLIQVTRDNQQITSLELKMATLKSRVSELEGSLSFAQENTNKVRQQALFDQERLTTIMKEVSNILLSFGKCILPKCKENSQCQITDTNLKYISWKEAEKNVEILRLNWLPERHVSRMLNDAQKHQLHCRVIDGWNFQKWQIT